MKTFVKVFLLVVILGVLASAVFAAPAASVKKDSDTVSVTLTPTHYKDLLILKSTKKYMGAAVEVHDGTGAVVASGRIHKKKMIVDFYDIPYGAYTICVVKDKKTLEFNYTKKQDSEILN
jgi:hypothetical protein